MFAPILLEAHNPSPMTGLGNNTYLLADHPGGVLIDAGVGNASHLSDLAAALSEQGARLDHVLVTHGHLDHASGAPSLALAHPGVRFSKHPWPGEDARHAVPWGWLEEGQVVDAAGAPLTVLHTPGHSPDHLAFWHQPSGSIFTGDLVVQGSSVMIHWSRGGDLACYLASLERLLALEPRQLLPAHGPIITRPAAVLRGYLDHRRMRDDQVYAAIRAGHSSVESVTESIYDGLSSTLVRAARENVRAHLEKLKAEGRVVQHEDGRWTA